MAAELQPIDVATGRLRADTSRREALLAAIRENALLRAENQPLLSPKGRPITWLIDMRRIFLDGNLLDLVADIFWDEFADRMPFQVGGMEVAAIPLLSAILVKSVSRGTPVNGFIVRKERKAHGAGNLIEGVLTDAPTVIIDDVVNSAASLEKIRVALEHANRRIDQVFVVIDYERPSGIAWRERHKVPIIAHLTARDLGLTFTSAAKPPPQASFTNIWKFAPPNPNFFHRVPKSFPATDGERIYFGSDCGAFWCLDAHSGKPLWMFRVNSPGHKNIWSAPALHDGKVFFGSYDGNVYCLDAKTGRESWRFIGADWVGSSPALAPDLGLLFIGLEFAVEGKRGSIVALNLHTGDKVWEHMTKRYTHASPAYWPELRLVACGSNDNEMFLFDAATGSLRWRFCTGGEGERGSIRHAPAFDMKRGHLITGCADGYIYIVDVDTGKEVWSVKTGNTIYTVPLVVNDTAYIGSTDKHFYILDLEKREVKKRIFCGSKIFGPARLLEGRVYFGACNGIVYEVDPTTGDVTGTHQLPDAVTNALIFSSSHQLYYALTYINQLYAFGRSTSRHHL